MIQSAIARLKLLAGDAILVAVEATCLGVAVASVPFRLVLGRLLRRHMVSVWTGVPIVNLPVNCRAEKLLGVRSVSIVRHSYGVTRNFDLVLEGVEGPALFEWLRPYLVLMWMCIAAKRVHAYCDGGILPQRHRSTFRDLELKVYDIVGIELFLWCYGADVRVQGITRSLGKPNCCNVCDLVGRACVCYGRLWADNYAKLLTHARAVFSMGDMIEYTPGSRNDLFYWPVDLDADRGRKYQPAFPEANHERALRVVHAPNDRVGKGTAHLKKAVRELADEGVHIELVLVEGVPNERALEVYRTADVIFDQCIAGFHGYFAIEGMALGKPVMCFIRKPEVYLCRHEECPIINTSIATLRDDLRSLAMERRGDLACIGQRGRSYVERHFSMAAFSSRLCDAYHDMGVVP